MSWDDYRLGKEYIGETIDKGFGYSQNFITLPENQVYDSGYGFFISSKLASEEEISLPDDYKVELIMNTELREEGKRYKRYKISGLELKEQVLETYMDVLLEKQIKAQKEKDRRNKKVMGNIVYGYYKGSIYAPADLLSTYFFVHDGIFYNREHQKVRNVTVEFTVMENVSKYFYDRIVSVLRIEMADWLIISKSIEQLKRVAQTNEKIRQIILQLEEEKRIILSEVIAKAGYPE